MVLASDTAQDVARFKHLMDEVHGQLERQLAAQENSLKLLQSRIESKRDYLTVMMATSVSLDIVNSGMNVIIHSFFRVQNLRPKMEVLKRLNHR